MEAWLQKLTHSRLHEKQARFQEGIDNCQHTQNKWMLMTIAGVARVLYTNGKTDGSEEKRLGTIRTPFQKFLSIL